MFSLKYFGMGMPKGKTYSVTVLNVTRGLLSVGEKQSSFVCVLLYLFSSLSVLFFSCFDYSGNFTDPADNLSGNHQPGDRRHEGDASGQAAAAGFLFLRILENLRCDGRFSGI